MTSSARISELTRIPDQKHSSAAQELQKRIAAVRQRFTEIGSAIDGITITRETLTAQDTKAVDEIKNILSRLDKQFPQPSSANTKPAGIKRDIINVKNGLKEFEDKLSASEQKSSLPTGEDVAQLSRELETLRSPHEAVNAELSAIIEDAALLFSRLSSLHTNEKNLLQKSKDHEQFLKNLRLQRLNQTLTEIDKIIYEANAELSDKSITKEEYKELTSNAANLRPVGFALFDKIQDETSAVQQARTEHTTTLSTVHQTHLSRTHRAIQAVCAQHSELSPESKGEEKASSTVTLYQMTKQADEIVTVTKAAITEARQVLFNTVPRRLKLAGQRLKDHQNPELKDPDLAQSAGRLYLSSLVLGWLGWPTAIISGGIILAAIVAGVSCGFALPVLFASIITCYVAYELNSASNVKAAQDERLRAGGKSRAERARLYAQSKRLEEEAHDNVPTEVREFAEREGILFEHPTNRDLFNEFGDHTLLPSDRDKRCLVIKRDPRGKHDYTAVPAYYSSGTRSLMWNTTPAGPSDQPSLNASPMSKDAQTFTSELSARATRCQR